MKLKIEYLKRLKKLKTVAEINQGRKSQSIILNEKGHVTTDVS